MSVNLTINVILTSGKSALFEGVIFGKNYTAEKDGIKISVGSKFPSPVKVTPPSISDPIKSIEYNLYTDMRNYHKVIVPDSGRFYMNTTQMVLMWHYKNESAINDAKMPIYLFTGQDLNMGMAFGIIGKGYETSFKLLEPKVNRALIVYMRRLSLQIKRGTDMYPICDTVAKENADGSITEHLYFRTNKEAPKQPWVMTLRDFATHQKRIYNIPDVTSKDALMPLWCSWTDWFSDDVTDKVILRNVQEGMKLGVKTYIIDDGWFGPGLDNDFSVKLNIGDWQADPAKIKDMKQLVKDVKKEGAIPLIWCAPHAVAEGANCFAERKKHLVVGADGNLLLTSNKFHSLCFMNPEARNIMAEICTNFIKDWDFDGAKYDLFNCVPNMKCCNTEHTHDVTSMMEGLQLTLKQIDEECRKLKKDYIVELKQNYGTPFLSRYGSMTRAGDTPYNTDGNFLRTLYVQAYSPYAINDYQTITDMDSPEDAGCIVIKMMSVGIPTYSIDFDRLGQKNKDVIAHYNSWYIKNLNMFSRYRVPQDGDNNVFKIEDKKNDFFFLVTNGGDVEVKKSCTILNGTHKKDITLRSKKTSTATVTVFNCLGKKTKTTKIKLKDWQIISVLPGCMVQVDIKK